MRSLTTAVVLFCGTLTAADIANADEVPPRPIDPARRTSTVRLLERCLPAVVAIRAYSPTEKPEETKINLGSGSLIHPAGFVITNAHVVAGATRGEAVLSNGDIVPYRLIAAFAHEDLAVIKLDVDRPLDTLPLGRSDDLLLGEPAFAIGSPAGLVSTASEGIVSGLNRSTSTEQAFLPMMIQTNAAISGGSSGGPLINVLGEQIGVVTSRKNDAENIAFAIAIDRCRDIFPALISAEHRYDFWFGAGVDMFAPRAVVNGIVSGSPADKAGLKIGDVIERCGDFEVRQGPDLPLALVGHKRDDKLKLILFSEPAAEEKEAVKEAIEQTGDGQTGDKPARHRAVEVVLGPLPLAEPDKGAGLAAGLAFAAYTGGFKAVPDFAQLKPAERGVTPTVSAGAFTAQRDNFALDLNGFVQAPADGLYTFSLKSDDGSRLFVDGQLLVDNDGLHPPREAAGLVRLRAGYHALRVGFFEGSGDEQLHLYWEGPNFAKQEVPAAALWHRPAK